MAKWVGWLELNVPFQQKYAFIRDEDGQGNKWHRNIAENFNRLTRVQEHYRQTTGGRVTAYSECEREITFAKNHVKCFLEDSLKFHSCYITVNNSVDV